jgi:hypothetical protein
MRIASMREFRGKATAMLRSKEPILVFHRGQIAGLFFPYPAEKRKLFLQLTDQIGQRLHQAGLTEEEILEDFERFRKAHRTSCRRR